MKVKRKAKAIFCLLGLLVSQTWLVLLQAAPAGATPANAVPAQTSQVAAAPAANAADRALRTAQILDVQDDLLAIRSGSSAGGGNINEQRWRITRKILAALLQVQTMENRIESDIAYTYDWMNREQRKVDKVNQLFNVANFLQFGVLYTIEPYLRINKQFLASACCTCTAAGMGVALPTANIMYNKFHRLDRLEVPTYLTGSIDIGPIGFANLPPYVERYMQQSAEGSAVDRKAELQARWKQLYGADRSKPESLGAVNVGKPRGLNVLNRRIVLLWSIFTSIQGFDEDLLLLLSEIAPPSTSVADQTSLSYLSPRAAQTAKLLSLDSILVNLADANPEVRSQARLAFLMRVMQAYLDIENSSDRCQKELNYQYDVVLAQLTRSRDKFLQKTYEANFIQNGTFGGIAGYEYIMKHGKTGNTLFIISGSTGIVLTTVSAIAARGGTRKKDYGPNSLADFFNLQHPESYGFSDLSWKYLNSRPAGKTDGPTRRERLISIWKNNAITTMNIDDPKVREKLAAMPSLKKDTINLVNNRTELLTSLEQTFEDFDGDLLALYQEVYAHHSGGNASDLALFLKTGNTAAFSATSPTTRIAPDSLERSANAFFDSAADPENKELATYAVLEALLEQSADANMISKTILTETQILHRMTRARDKVINLTNLANFYQIGILGVTYNGIGLSARSQNVLYADRINIVSGYMVSNLALLALAETRGGWRPGSPEPNALSSAFKLPYKEDYKTRLSPFVVHHLDSEAPYSSQRLSRRNELIAHWKNSKAFSVNVEKPGIAEKLSATKEKTHFWDESIKLVRNRIYMLYDLKAVVRSSNVGLGEFL